MTQPAEAQHQARRLGSRGIVAGQAAGQGQSFLNTFFLFSFELCLGVICIILAYTASLLLLEDKPSHRPSNLPFLRPTPSSTVRRLLRETKASTSTSSCTGVP